MAFNTSKQPAPARRLRKTSSAGGAAPSTDPPAKGSKPAKRPAKLSKAEITEIFQRLRDANPVPASELEYVNPFTLLVAVALSAQATDVSVNKATRSLFKTVDTPEKMVALGEDALRETIRTIGLYRNKAKNVIALSKALIENHGGEVPRTRAELEALPGVGRKTANVVLNVAFQQPTIAVDTHIFRVANRIGLVEGKTPLDVELGLERVVPQEFRLHAHHWLILHGRYICKARKPECPRCPIIGICRYEPKTTPQEMPIAREMNG
jgi:endonuclease III